MPTINFVNRADPEEHPVEYALKFYDGYVVPLTVIDNSKEGLDRIKDRYVLNLFNTDTLPLYVFEHGFDPDVIPLSDYGYRETMSREPVDALDANVYDFAISRFKYGDSITVNAGITRHKPSADPIYPDNWVVRTGASTPPGYFGVISLAVNISEGIEPTLNDINLIYGIQNSLDNGEVTEAYWGLYPYFDTFGFLPYMQGCEFIDFNVTPIIPWTDKTSEEGGNDPPYIPEGTGVNPESGDIIAPPSAPYGTDALLSGSTGAGFLTAFKPSKEDLISLGSILWARVFSDDWTDRIFQGLQKPMDYIAGLAILPIDVPTNGSKQVRFAGIVIDQSAPSLPLISNQYPEFDCGTIAIEKYWGSALDYEPYTHYSVFLPFIGTRELNTDEIMGTTLGLKYRFDVVSGICTAMITVNGSVYYQYSGSCAQNIPLSARDYTQNFNAAVNMAISAASVVATKGVAAAATTPQAVAGANAAVSAAVGGAVTSAVNVVQAKPSIQHAGAVSGNAGMIGVLTPYLIVTRPTQSLAEGYNTFEGFPSNITSSLGACHGFTKVDSIHLENIPATDSELAEIENKLKEGVII